MKIKIDITIYTFEEITKKTKGWIYIATTPMAELIYMAT
jgi:hypothetical protein